MNPESGAGRLTPNSTEKHAVTRPSAFRSHHLSLSACLRCPDSVCNQWKSRTQELSAECSRRVCAQMRHLC